MSNLAFEETGDGTPVVFLHGIAMDRSAWRPVIDVLSARHRCISVDLAGHGESPRSGAYDVFSQSAAVAELLAELALDQPLVVGHSYGAFTATLLGATAPVAGVVNVDQELDTASFQTAIRPFADRLRGDDFDAAFTEFVATLRPDLVPPERHDLAVMRPDPEVVLGVWTMVFDTPAAELNAMIEPVLSTYPVPYLAIFGSSVSAEERRLVDLVPDAEVEEWDGLGHFVHLVEPGRTAERIAAFASHIAR